MGSYWSYYNARRGKGDWLWREPLRLFRYCHPVSNDVVRSQGVCGDTPAWTPEAAPFRSRRTLLTPRPRSSLIESCSRTSGPTIHLFGTCTHDCSLRTPRFSGRQVAHSSARLLLAGHRMTRAHLHDGLTQLRVRPVFAQHQVQPRGQLPGHRHLGDTAILAHRQAAIEAFQLRIVARRRLSRFHQQKAQKRTALFADLAQPLFSAAGIFTRNQAEVAAHLLA